MNELFPSSEPTRDPIYEGLRSCEWLRRDRQRLEEMWSEYYPYADPHFLREIRDEFIARYWEMHVGCAFLENGWKLQRSSGGPDLKVSRGHESLVAIEVVAPGGGTGPDRVTEPESGAYWVPHDDIILRYRAALAEKRAKHCDYLRAGSIDRTMPYVVALNPRKIPKALSDARPPRLVQALFGLGPEYVTLDRETLQRVDHGIHVQTQRIKRSGASVPTDIFLDDSHREISAVIYACAPVNQISDDLMSDLTLAHNACAANPLPRGWLQAGTEIWAENGVVYWRTVPTSTP